MTGGWRIVETTRQPSRLAHLPHVLSLARVLLVAGTYLAAWRHDEAQFALLVLLAVLTDILDGPLARHLGTANRFGANVDSAADFAFYASLPVWAYLFRPELMLAPHVIVPIITGTILYVGANVASHRTFGALGVHNRLSRTSGTIGIVVAFSVILWGLPPLLYYGMMMVVSADLAQRYGAVLGEIRRRRQATRAAGPSQGR